MAAEDARAAAAPKYEDATDGDEAYPTAGCIAGKEAKAADMEKPAWICWDPICFLHRALRLLNHT